MLMCTGIIHNTGKKASGPKTSALLRFTEGLRVQREGWGLFLAKPTASPWPA